MTLTVSTSTYDLSPQQNDIYEVLDSLAQFCFKECGYVTTLGEWWLYGQYVALEQSSLILDSKTYNLKEHVCDIRHKMLSQHQLYLEFKEGWTEYRIAKQEGILAGYERALLIITQITGGVSTVG